VLLDRIISLCYNERDESVETDDTKPASEVFDRGRRGEPLMGCDCMQCFGYCPIDRETANREARDRFYQRLAAARIADMGSV